jgi:hypothetical protein
MRRPMKRVVTGHDGNGQAVIISAAEPPNIVELQKMPGTVFYELWRTTESPAPVDNGPDLTLGPLRLPPTSGGTVFRIVDIPPDTTESLRRSAEEMKQAFGEIGDADASTVKRDSPHPLMHRTQSIDYGIVLEGEIALILDQGEVALKAGDVVVQRGTNHGWANRGRKTCRMAFILIDGRYEPSIAVKLDGG